MKIEFDKEKYIRVHKQYESDASYETQLVNQQVLEVWLPFLFFYICWYLMIFLIIQMLDVSRFSKWIFRHKTIIILEPDD